MPKVTSIRLPDKLVDRLDRIAQSLDRPRSWVMRQALEGYVAARVGSDAAPDEPDVSADLPVSHQKVIAALEHMIEDAVKHAPEAGASEASPRPAPPGASPASNTTREKAAPGERTEPAHAKRGLIGG